jgi:hypothetical protein
VIERVGDVQRPLRIDGESVHGVKDRLHCRPPIAAVPLFSVAGHRDQSSPFGPAVNMPPLQLNDIHVSLSVEVDTEGSIESGLRLGIDTAVPARRLSNDQFQVIGRHHTGQDHSRAPGESPGQKQRKSAVELGCQRAWNASVC